MLKTITLLLSILFCITLYTQAQTPDNSVTKSFLIIQSTKNYNRASKKAQITCNDLGYTMNLRNLYYDKNEGLTTSEICGCGEKHGYIARGRFDDGLYTSIEYSSSYESFTPGYYIVVVASGERDDLIPILKEVRKTYPDAYIKDSKVYMGCTH